MADPPTDRKVSVVPVVENKNMVKVAVTLTVSGYPPTPPQMISIDQTQPLCTHISDLCLV